MLQAFTVHYHIWQIQVQEMERTLWYNTFWNQPLSKKVFRHYLNSHAEGNSPRACLCKWGVFASVSSYVHCCRHLLELHSTTTSPPSLVHLFRCVLPACQCLSLCFAAFFHVDTHDISIELQCIVFQGISCVFQHYLWYWRICRCWNISACFFRPLFFSL